MLNPYNQPEPRRGAKKQTTLFVAVRQGPQLGDQGRLAHTLCRLPGRVLGGAPAHPHPRSESGEGLKGPHNSGGKPPLESSSPLLGVVGGLVIFFRKRGVRPYRTL